MGSEAAFPNSPAFLAAFILAACSHLSNKACFPCCNKQQHTVMNTQKNVLVVHVPLMSEIAAENGNVFIVYMVIMKPTMK